jgi:predicted dehydrogenase/nucleoside-diphosphate-sugar epimerase
MKIGIIGCGLNSDYHINFAKAYPGAEIVGIVDNDREKARACSERFGISGVYSSVSEMIKQARPDVVHVVTPPKTHYSVASEAIQAGCNVLIEKPLALDREEAQKLFDLADQKGVKLCAMHNHNFDPCMLKAIDLVQNGQVGEIMNVESYYGINTFIPAFRDYPAPNVLPWLYTLPGGVYHDFMAHPLYVMLDYTGRPKELKVFKKAHGILPQGMPDELKIIIDGEKAFGTLTFSFAARPHLHFIRFYGSKMMVEIDINTMTTVTHPISSLPKAAQKATYNLSESWQLFTSTVANVVNFVRKKLKPYQGMKILIHRFYDSLQGKGVIPVSREQALLVIETMDEIWKQVQPRPLVFDPIVPPSSYEKRQKEKVLVTGGTGFLGRKIVDGLVATGYPVRVLARKLSNIEFLKDKGIEIYYGDVADKGSLEKAFEGIDFVIHAAAGTSGRTRDCEIGTLQGTRNVLDLCEQRRIKKMVYISSCSVYGVADYKTDQVVTEDSSLERFPAQRGEYSASKQQAESFVIEARDKKKVPVVILRPGTIYGPGGELFTPMMGFSLFRKAFIVIGNGKFELPLVYIDNLVDAIIKSMQTDKADGQILNVVDSERMNKKQYVKRLIKVLYPKAPVFYFPFSLLYAVTWAQEVLFRTLKRNPFLTRYRLISSQRNISYDSSKIVDTLAWQPRVSVDDAILNIVDFERKRMRS